MLIFLIFTVIRFCREVSGISKFYEIEKLGIRLSDITRISGFFGKGCISLGMGMFDLLAWGAGLFAPDNAFTAFNQQHHSNSLYNAF